MKSDIRENSYPEKMERELDEAERASRLHCMSNLPWKEVRLHGSFFFFFFHDFTFFFFFSLKYPFIFIFIFLFVVNFVIHWNETAMCLHVFPIPIPPPTSLCMEAS